jgi:alpha-beta hydrolase superfamily lysophospholipase
MKDLGWIRAIHTAHEQVQEGLNVETPILLMHSDCSIRDKNWTEEYTHCDGVLDIDNMKKFGHRLGPHVTFDEIQGGLHDLYLSAKDAREKAYRETFEFFDKHSTL